MVIVELATAAICFMGSCYPALVGVTTPTGQFQLEQRSTPLYGYGGDVLVFKETDVDVFAIHRVLNLVPEQRRPLRLKSIPADRLITNGCINVAPDVYQKLVDCCASDQLEIK